MDFPSQPKSWQVLLHSPASPVWTAAVVAPVVVHGVRPPPPACQHGLPQEARAEVHGVVSSAAALAAHAAPAAVVVVPASPERHVPRPHSPASTVVAGAAGLEPALGTQGEAAAGRGHVEGKTVEDRCVVVAHGLELVAEEAVVVGRSLCPRDLVVSPGGGPALQPSPAVTSPWLLVVRK